MTKNKKSKAGQELQLYLKKNGLSQGRFAVLTLGVTDTAVQSWLSGRGRPSLPNAMKIENLTGIKMADWLVPFTVVPEDLPPLGPDDNPFEDSVLA
jgi:transcriptional regulator with XRE-family HTH domain